MNHDLESFETLVRSRRATRRFKRDPIPDGLLARVLDTARWAPSGYNLQPTHFVVVTDPALKERDGQDQERLREQSHQPQRDRPPVRPQEPRLEPPERGGGLRWRRFGPGHVGQSRDPFPFPRCVCQLTR